MKTYRDLEAALGLLADEAVEHNAAKTVGSPESLPATRTQPGRDDLGETQPASAPSTRRHVLAGLSAAVVITAIALGAAELVRSTSGPVDAGGSADSLPTSIPFRVGAAAEVTVVGVDVSSPTDLETYVYGQGRSIVLQFVNSPSSTPPADQAAQVTIDGRPGFFTCLETSGHDVTGCPVVQLTWKTSRGRWMSSHDARAKGHAVPTRTTAASRRAERGQLLRVARNLDFSKATPLLSPIALQAAPQNSSLTSYGLQYDQDAETGQALHAPLRWSAYFTFTSSSSGQSVVVTASTDPLPSATRDGRRAVTISGYHGVWENTTHRLWLQEGAVLILVSVDHPTDLNTLTKIASFATGIAVASPPGERKNWFEVAAALP